MEKQSLWSRIKNFFLHLLALIASLFKKDNKKEVQELQVFEENISRNAIKLKQLDQTTLPDTQSTKTSNEEETSTDNIEKEVVLYKRDKKSEIMDVFKEIALTYDEDRLKEKIDKILKEKYYIDVKRAKKILEENIEKLKEELLEDVEEKIKKQELKKEEQLDEYLEEEIKKKIEEHPLDKPYPPTKYVIATTVRDNIAPKKGKPPVIKSGDVIKTTPKRKKEAIKDRANNTKIAMIKTHEPAVIKPKDKLFVAASTATVVLTSVASDLIIPFQKQEDVKIIPKKKTAPELKPLTKEEIKPEEIEIAKTTPDPVQLKEIETPTIEAPKEVEASTKEVEEETVLTIAKDIQKEKQETQATVQTKLNEFQYVDDHNDEIKSNELAQINKERLEKENEKIILELKAIEEEIATLKEQKEDLEEAAKVEVQEEPVEELPKPKGAAEEEKKEETKEQPKKEETKKEEKKETPPPAPDLDLTEHIDSTVTNSKIEMKSDKELEDKRYDEYEQEINELLYDIELYRIKYDKNLTKEQKKKLKDEERKLRTAKSNIQYQKSLDIEKERKHLEQEILPEELHGLQLELRKKHLENKRDLNEELIERVEDLEFMTDEKVSKLEKKLIKKKLRKALIVTQMGSILALPFIRNKYFFYFTAGLIAKTELMFLSDLFKRKTSEYDPVELTAIKNGKDALYGALNTTRENILYLESLEATALAKYPELSFDSEYLQYLNSLKSSLARTQDKLSRKIDTLDRYIRKTTRKVRKLEKKLVPDEEEEEQ